MAVISSVRLLFEVVEGLIQPTALFARRCWWVPELHASIVFEDAFDNKLFSQQNKEKQRSKSAPDRSKPTHLTKPLHTHSPSCSRHCLKRVARSWGQGWPGACEGPPGGLGLDAGEDGATLSKPGAGAAIGISALRQAQGTWLLSALRQAQGTWLLSALRQAQGTFDQKA